MNSRGTEKGQGARLCEQRGSEKGLEGGEIAVKGQITQSLIGYTSEVSAAVMPLNKQPLRLCGVRHQSFIYCSWVSRALQATAGLLACAQDSVPSHPGKAKVRGLVPYEGYSQMAKGMGAGFYLRERTWAR